MILLTHPQGSPEWLRARAGVCTASRFADARSVVVRRGGPAGRRVEPSAVATRYAWTLAMERIAGRPLDAAFSTPAMRRGQRLEADARATYEAHTGATVEETSLILTEDRRFGYSSDGLVGDAGLIEVKVPSACDRIGGVWSAPEEAHVDYLAQIEGGLWLTGREWCDLVIYMPWLESVGKDLWVRRIWRDDASIERLEDELLAFAAVVDGFEEVLRAVAPTRTELRPAALSPLSPLVPTP